MRKKYSANEELRIFSQNLGFKLYLFDDPDSIGDEIKLEEVSKHGEIDAIMIHENVICAVSINKGKSSQVRSARRKFFEKLDRVSSIEELNLDLKISKNKSKSIEGNEKIARNMLGEIEDHIDKYCKTYKIIFRKLFFCPNVIIEPEVIEKAKKNKHLIIDKDIFEYFMEILNRLNKGFLFRDFIHYLDVRNIDLMKIGPSRSKKAGKSSPFKVDRIELRDKLIMYSLSLRVEDIINYITVLRVAGKYDKRGFQRMVKRKRLDKINRDYLNENETFPNNIILAFNPTVYKQEVNFYDKSNNELSFYDEFNSLIVIDGQHRLLSFVAGEITERFILVTLIFFRYDDIKASFLAMDRMFYVINKKQEKVDPCLSFILIARIDPESRENFWYNTFQRLDKSGFFSKRFSFKESTIRMDRKKSIVSVIQYGGVLNLNKRIKRKGIYADGLDTFYGEDRLTNIEFAFRLIKNYFYIITMILTQQGFQKEDLSPREIGALLRLIRHFIIDNSKEVKKLGGISNIKQEISSNTNPIRYFKRIILFIPFQDVIALGYGASNWAAVEGFMLRRIHDRDPNFGNKALLSKKGLEVYRESTSDK